MIAGPANARYSERSRCSRWVLPAAVTPRKHDRPSLTTVQPASKLRLAQASISVRRKPRTRRSLRRTSRPSAVVSTLGQFHGEWNRGSPGLFSEIHRVPVWSSRRRRWGGVGGRRSRKICANGCWRRSMAAWRSATWRRCSGSACPPSTRFGFGNCRQGRRRRGRSAAILSARFRSTTRRSALRSRSYPT